jgi:hypothetical protein
MVNKRIELHERLVAILGSSNVYFQPPASIKMQYPAIVYNRSRIKKTFANDSVYGKKVCYEVTLITQDPDDEIVDILSNMQHCEFNRHFTSDNLNHDIFNLYV